MLLEQNLITVILKLNYCMFSQAGMWLESPIRYMKQRSIVEPAMVGNASKITTTIRASLLTAFRLFVCFITPKTLLN